MKLSIITVCFNSANTIRETIESVLSQTYRNIEYIIVDGGSEDGSISIIADYSDRISKFVSEPDKGIYDAMNKGIHMATGDIVGMINSDDILYDSSCIDRIVDQFKSTNADAVYGNLVITNNNDEIIRRWVSRPFESGLFSKSWTPAHPTFYCKKSMFVKYGLYKTDFKIAADVELMLRFMEIHGIKTSYLDSYIVKMRSGGISNQGLRSTLTITREMSKAFSENGLRFNYVYYLFFKLLKVREFVRN